MTQALGRGRMKERWLLPEQQQNFFAHVPDPTTASLLDRARDFAWRCLGGHADEAVIEATAHKIVRAFRGVMR